MAQQVAARPSPKESGGSGRLLRLIPTYAALLILTLIFVAPLLWMVSTSFKTKSGSVASPPAWIPQEISWAGYQALLNAGSDTPVLRWFINSMIAASAQTVLILVTASMAAYALARMSFRGKRIVFALIISTLLIPQFVFLIGNYLIVDSFGWLDTLIAVIVPGAAGAFGVFFLRQFFMSLPGEIEEAALIDGANRFQIFTRIILPISKAPLATLAVLSFLTNWNDFLWPVYVLFNPSNLTLPAGLAALQGGASLNYPVIMAGGVLASVPVLIIYLFAQRYVIAGVSRSGLKG
jgi:multiple sugar transport system permease protein